MSNVIKAHLHVHLKRGHTHVFDLVDPHPEELDTLVSDPLVEVLTTEQLGDQLVYVRVVGVDGLDLLVEMPNHDLAILH